MTHDRLLTNFHKSKMGIGLAMSVIIVELLKKLFCML
jgi:hypothetical protein